MRSTSVRSQCNDTDETNEEMLTTPGSTGNETLKVQGERTETDPTVDKAALSLDKIVPSISTEKTNALVVACLEKLHTLDISHQDAWIFLVGLLLEIIQTVTSEIVAAFQNAVLLDKEVMRPPLIYEEAVRKALHCSLCDSFEAALGSAHKCPEDLLKLIFGEVTSRVNSALSRCKVQGARMVVEVDRGYKTPREILKAMAHQAKAILRSVRDKLCTKCGPCYCGPAHLEEACPYTEQGSPEAPLQPVVEEGQERALKSKFCVIKEKLCQRRARRVGPAHSEQISLKSTKAASPTTSLEKVLESVQDILEMEVIEMDNFKEENMSSEFLTSIRGDCEDAVSTIASIIRDEISFIRSDNRQNSHTSIPLQNGPIFYFDTKQPRLKGAGQKIKDFFVLCYAKIAFHSLLCRLCKQTTGCAISIKELMERASALLNKLRPERATDSQEGALCVYKRLSQDISSGQHKQLSQELVNLITQNLEPQKGHSTFRSKVRAEIDSFMNSIVTWLQTQQRQLVLDNRVQRALRRIRRMAHESFPPKIPVSPKEDYTPAPCLRSEVVTQTQHLSPLQNVKKGHVFTEATRDVIPTTKAEVSKLTILNVGISAGQEVPEATAQPLYVWERHHCSFLVFEVVDRVLRGQKGPDMNELEFDLVQRLQSKMVHIQGDIQVKPTACHIKKVAECIYRDLCSNDHKKKSVARVAVNRTDYRAEIVDCMSKHLVTPQKKSRFRSLFHSVSKAFCLPWGGSQD